MFESSSEIGYFVRALRTLDDGLRAHISSVDEIVKPDQPEEVVETKPAVPEKPKGIPGGSKKSAKVKLTVRINFLKIGAIDTLKDRFNAEILVTAKWREPSLDGKKKELRYIKWDEQWTPRMTVSNTVGEAKMMASYNVFFDGKDRATACETKKVVGQFYESMELYDFPFDKQDLTVCATSERGLEEVELIEDDVEPSALNMRAFSAEQEWSLKEELKKWNKVTTKKVNNVKVKYPSFCVAARATRRPQFFIFNVFIVLIALCSMAFSSFTVSQELTPNRLQLTFTLILTCVTFKFVVSKSLPKISYLTLVDKYILGSMVILICMCYWHAISGGMIYQMFPKAGSVVATSTTTAIPTVSSFQTSVEDESSGDTALTTLQSDIGDQGSITSTAAPNKTIKCPTVAAAASTKPGPDAIKIDKVALGIFAGIYSSFNMYFLVKVIIGYCKGDEEGGDEEPDGGDDDEDGGD